LFDSLVPPVFSAAPPIGVSERGVFVSEFGCVAMSSDFSMNGTLSPALRSFTSDAMRQRNYPCNNLIDVYFGSMRSDAWSWNLYACMMAQNIYMTGRIAQYRASNVFGIQVHSRCFLCLFFFFFFFFDRGCFFYFRFGN
jgi:hypothetical protein